MSTVLIWLVVIVGIVGILLFWSLANTAGWADDRMEEIKNRETSCEAVITNQSRITSHNRSRDTDRCKNYCNMRFD